LWVEFRQSDSTVPLQVNTCSFEYRLDAETTITMTRKVDAQGRATLCNIAANDFTVVGLDGSSKVVVSERIQDATKFAPLITIVVGNKDSRFTVVDGKGEPVTSVDVMLYSAPEGQFGLFGRTDGSGEVGFGDLHGDIVDLCLLPVTGGSCMVEGVRVSDKEPARVVMINDATLALTDKDGQSPVGGIGIRIAYSRVPHDWVDEASSQASGSLVFSKLGTQEMIALCDQPGIWAEPQRFVPSKSGQSFVFQVRRTGSVVIVASRAGALLADAPARIRSIEFQTGIEGWLSAGRIKTSTGTLRTDAEGRLRIDALPHGSYSIEFTRSDGELFSSSFDVGVSTLIEAPFDIP
jgi:hypothetical protein